MNLFLLPRKLKRGLIILLLTIGLSPSAFASKVFIPMDADGQANHLKAYGVAYAALTLKIGADWLLNYKGGAFAIDHVDAIERLCKLRGVSYEVISDAQYTGVLQQIGNPDFNGDVIK